MAKVAEIERFVAATFGSFGVNKSREIVRLLYEIGRRDRVPSLAAARGLEGRDFDDVKDELLKKRYPESYTGNGRAQFYLPKLELNDRFKAPRRRGPIRPKIIYVEEGLEQSVLASRLKERFPGARTRTIVSLKDFLRGRSFTLVDYNRRLDRFFVVKEHYDFARECPCTSRAVSCGYRLLNLGFGCPYECSYCFLQGYQNVPGILLPANIGDFFSGIAAVRKRPFLFGSARIGSGEFTDSLVFDELTGFSKDIVAFFRQHPELTFEFKTKSTAVANLLAMPPAPNIVVAWSLNPPGVVAAHEGHAPSLEERIAAAKECARAGYGVAFHFDPLLYSPGWEKDYRAVVDYLFDELGGARWISLGTLRMTPALKKAIENRFPSSTILDGELLLGFDRKLRYHEQRRIVMYRAMAEWIRKRSTNTVLYLCMEERRVWEQSDLWPAGRRVTS